MTAPAAPLTPAPARSRPVRPLLFGAGGVAVVALLGSDDGVVLCPFRRCTGLECAGCGMTRSAAHLARGDLAGSFAHHPLGPLVVVQLVAALVLAVVRPRWLPGRVVIGLVVANALLLNAVWIGRLVTGDIGPGLASVWP